MVYIMAHSDLGLTLCARYLRVCVCEIQHAPIISPYAKVGTELWSKKYDTHNDR